MKIPNFMSVKEKPKIIEQSKIKEMALKDNLIIKTTSGLKESKSQKELWGGFTMKTADSKKRLTKKSASIVRVAWSKPLRLDNSQP